MRFAGNFSSEWGYLAPAPRFARTARIVLVATAIGATAGAGVVLSLIDRSPAPQLTSVAARAIVTSVHEAAAPAASEVSAAPIAPVTAPVTGPAASPASPPESAPVAPSEVATQSTNHALVPPSQPAAAPSEANASAEVPTQTQLPVTPAENAAPTRARETSATSANAAETSVPETGPTTGANSESANAAPHPAAGVAALAEPSAAGTTVDAADAGASAEGPAPQKKAKHHVGNEEAAFPGLGTFFRRFFVAHAVRPNYSNR